MSSRRDYSLRDEIAARRDTRLRALIGGRGIDRRPDDPEQWRELIRLDWLRLRRLEREGRLVFDARGNAVMRTRP